MTRALLPLTILTACVAAPTEFGATAESSGGPSDTTAGECTDCAFRLEWEQSIDGAPLTAATDDLGRILLIRRTDEGEHELVRIPAEGGAVETLPGISPLAQYLIWCDDIILVSDVEGGGYRLGRLADDADEPSWSDAPVLVEGWAQQLMCLGEGSVGVLGWEAQAGVSSAFLHAVDDAGETIASWSDSFGGDIQGVASLGDLGGGVAIWIETRDAAGLGTGTVIRLGADLVEVDRTELELGPDLVSPPVAIGDGWTLAGNNDAGVWLQSLDSSFQPIGARIVDASAPPHGGRSRAFGAGIAMLAADDLGGSQLRYYAADATLVGFTPLPAMHADAEYTQPTGIERTQDDLLVIAFDVPLDVSGNPGVPEGWVRRFATD
jgi:hypothetical protein